MGMFGRSAGFDPLQEPNFLALAIASPPLPQSGIQIAPDGFVNRTVYAKVFAILVSARRFQRKAFNSFTL
jgi:hypothetical protein